MIKDLREINRVLIAIKQLSVNGFARKIDILNECTKIVLGGKSSDHDETISFCISCGIISELEKQLLLTPFGEKLIKANPENNWELNESQKNLLIENCFLDGFCKDESISILKQFYPDNKRKTFVFSKKDDFILKNISSNLQLFFQIDLIQKDDKVLFVNPLFSKYLSYLLGGRKMSLAELDQHLKIDREIGDIAEKIVLEYEKNRLKNEESADSESTLVQIISGTDVTAGYDVESFDGKTIDLEFNRHIEVKGSTGNDLSFYWSSGEIKKARELETSYWLYFVSGIDRKTHSYHGKITKIPNPSHDVFESGKYSSNCTKYHVTKYS
jgi:hypothetical protein